MQQPYPGVFGRLEAEGRIHGFVKPYVRSPENDYPKMLYFEGLKEGVRVKNIREELAKLDEYSQQGMAPVDSVVRDPLEDDLKEAHRIAEKAEKRAADLEKELAELRAKSKLEEPEAAKAPPKPTKVVAKKAE